MSIAPMERKIIEIENDIERLEERVETVKGRVEKIEVNASRIVWIIITAVMGAILSLVFIVR